jgi:gliotoxin/aspirochlorine/mycotoxins biosynthesis cytochrome P450 monooxygenase
MKSNAENVESVITSPEEVKNFYSDSAIHEKSASSNGGWVFHQLLGDCLGLINGERWTRLRKLLEKSGFDRQTAYSRISGTLAYAKRYVEKLSSQSIDYKAESQLRVSAVQATVKFPFLYTAGIIYGNLDESQEGELWSLGQRRVALMRYVIRGGIYRSSISWFLSPQMRHELAGFREEWRQFNKRMAAKITSREPSTAIFPLLWRYALEKGASEAQVSGDLDESKGHILTSLQKQQRLEEVLQTLDEMLFANLDVTTHVLSWMVILVSGDAALQQELRAEVEANRKDMILYISSKNTLLHWCFMETLRVRPVSGEGC